MGRFTSTFNDIANAIIAKDGKGSMTPAQMPTRINQITSGNEAGNGLPYGCPRVDMVTLDNSYYEGYLVYDLRYITEDAELSIYTSGQTVEEVTIANDGTVTPTGNVQSEEFGSIILTKGAFRVLHYKTTSSSSLGYYSVFANTYKVRCVAILATVLPSSAYSFTHKIFMLQWLKVASVSELTVEQDTRLHYLSVGNIGSLKQFVFDGCTSLDKIVLSGTTTNMSYTFRTALKVSEIDLSGLDMSGVSSIAYIFNSTLTNLVTFKMPSDPNKGLRCSFSISYCPNLTRESLLSILGSLYDLASAGLSSQTLTMGSGNLAKLTAEEQAIATDKGWTLA